MDLTLAIFQANVFKMFEVVPLSLGICLAVSAAKPARFDCRAGANTREMGINNRRSLDGCQRCVHSEAGGSML